MALYKCEGNAVERLVGVIETDSQYNSSGGNTRASKTGYLDSDYATIDSYTDGDYAGLRINLFVDGTYRIRIEKYSTQTTAQEIVIVQPTKVTTISNSTKYSSRTVIHDTVYNLVSGNSVAIATKTGKDVAEMWCFVFRVLA